MSLAIAETAKSERAAKVNSERVSMELSLSQMQRAEMSSSLILFASATMAVRSWLGCLRFYRFDAPNNAAIASGCGAIPSTLLIVVECGSHRRSDAVTTDQNALRR
jgi:hypothetical protein